MHIIEKLAKQQVIHPPDYAVHNSVYLTVMGSEAYGVATDFSDKDIYGVAIPPKNYIFPHLTGYVHGFDKLPAYCGEDKQEWSKHHVQTPDVEYDFKVFQIHKFFRLAAQGNPGTIDMMFVPRECIIYSNQIGEYIRENRKFFLSKEAWPRYKGYAYGELSGLEKYDPKGKRAHIIEKYGYDVKHAYHVLRLLNFIEQILMNGELDVRQGREQWKSVRHGEWTLDEIKQYFAKKESELESLFLKSGLKDSVDRDEARSMLVHCLEIHYGNLSDTVSSPGKSDRILEKIRNLVQTA